MLFIVLTLFSALHNHFLICSGRHADHAQCPAHLPSQRFAPRRAHMAAYLDRLPMRAKTNPRSLTPSGWCPTVGISNLNALA